MIDNKKLLNKKNFTKYDLMALPDIVLNPEEADRFIDYVIDESVWKDHVRIEKMAKPEKNIRYLGFGSGRFLYPATTFSSADYKKEFGEDKLTLTTKKVRGAVVVFDDDLSDNIEGDAFYDHLLQIVAKKIANEMDEAYYSSNSGYGATDIRSLWEGWRYRIFNQTTPDSANWLDATKALVDHTSDFIDAGKIAERNTTSLIWQFKYSKMLQTLPSKYKKVGLKNLRFFQNGAVTVDYIDALASRQTVMGDQAILGNGQMQYGGVPIIDVPSMSTTYAATDLTNDGLESATSGVYTDVLLTTSKNLIIGLQLELKMETERSAADEANYVFYSMRADLAIEQPEACVLLVNLTHTG